MKILVISAVFPPYKVPEADRTLRICEHLASKGHEIHLLTTDRHEIVMLDSINIHSVIKSWSWRDLPALVKHLQVIKPEGIFLLFLASFYNYNAMITLAPILIKFMKLKASFVVQFTNVSVGRVPKNAPVSVKFVRWVAQFFGKFSYGFLLTHSTQIIVVSTANMKRLHELCPSSKEKTLLVPPPPLIKVLSNEQGEVRRKGRSLLSLDYNEIVISYFGRLYPGKGIEDAFRIFQRTLEEYPTLKFLVIGGYLTSNSWVMQDSYDKKLLNLIKQLGISDRVIWSGEYTWDSEIPSLYLYASDICLLPFTSGVSLLNGSFSAAVAHNLPVVSTYVDVLSHPFVHKVNGLYCPAGDMDSLSEATKLLIENKPLREKLGKGAAELATSYFNWEVAISTTLNALKLAY